MGTFYPVLWSDNTGDRRARGSFGEKVDEKMVLCLWLNMLPYGGFAGEIPIVLPEEKV